MSSEMDEEPCRYPAQAAPDKETKFPVRVGIEASATMDQCRSEGVALSRLMR